MKKHLQPFTLAAIHARVSSLEQSASAAMPKRETTCLPKDDSTPR